MDEIDDMLDAFKDQDRRLKADAELQQLDRLLVEQVCLLVVWLVIAWASHL